MIKIFTNHFWKALSFCVLLSGNAIAQLDLQSGLVGHYTFEGDASDVSGNGNHGQPSGSATNVADMFGNETSAYAIGGPQETGAIQILNSPDLQFSTAASFSFWARFDSDLGLNGFGHHVSGGIQCLFSKQSDGGSLFNYSSVSVPNEELSLIFGNSGITGVSHVLTPYQLGDWVHVAYVATTSGHSLYVNGALVSSIEGTYNFTGMNESDLFLGRFGSGWYPLNGALDEFRVYDRALNADEVALLAQDRELYIEAQSETAVCQGAELAVAYNSFGNIEGTDPFALELSDATGDFTNADTIGTFVSTAVADTIYAVVPNTTAAGDYRIRIVRGTLISDTSFLVVRALPVAEITGDDMFCAGESTTLTASSGAEFEWSTEEMTQAIEVFEAGDYWVTVTNEFGCSNTSEVFTVVESACTGISASEAAFFTARPNPATDRVELNWNSSMDVKSVVISDITGNAVSEIATNGGDSLVIELSQYTPGVYFVKVIGQQTQVLKIVKK